MRQPRRIEIVGGGLAGLTLGLALRQQAIPVVVQEAGYYPRHRVCGEFLTGLDDETLRLPGLGEALAAARTARHVVWFEPGRPPLSHELPEPALCLSRWHLDQALARAFEAAGGELHTGRRTPPAAAPGRVLACGRRPAPAGQWIGLKAHFKRLVLAGDLEVHLGRDAYVGLTRVEDGLVNVCGLFPRHPESRTLAAACKNCGLPGLSRRLEAAGEVPGSACAVAGLDYHAPTPPATNVALGDHHALIPPFTGHGMTIALQMAAAAVGPLVAWANGESDDWARTTSRIRREVHRRCAGRLARARRLHPWMLRPSRRWFLHSLHRCGLLPLGSIYRLLH